VEISLGGVVKGREERWDLDALGALEEVVEGCGVVGQGDLLEGINHKVCWYDIKTVVLLLVRGVMRLPVLK